MSTLSLKQGFKPGTFKLTRNEILELIADKLNSDNHKKSDLRMKLAQELDELAREVLKTDKRVAKVVKLVEQLGGKVSTFTEGSDNLGVRIQFKIDPPAKTAVRMAEIKKEHDTISCSYRHWHKDDVLNTLMHSNPEVQKTVAEMAETVTAAVNSQIPKLIGCEAS